LFADASSTVDIYNGGSGIWTTAQLSSARFDLAATSLPEQDLALFAGGYDGNCACSCPIFSLFLAFSRFFSLFLAFSRFFSFFTRLFRFLSRR
jgi:hypothetical protein